MPHWEVERVKLKVYKVESVRPPVFTTLSQFHFCSATVWHITAQEKRVSAHGLKTSNVTLVVLLKVWQLKVLKCGSCLLSLDYCLFGFLHLLGPLVCVQKLLSCSDNLKSEAAEMSPRGWNGRLKIKETNLQLEYMSDWHCPPQLQCPRCSSGPTSR